MRDRAPAYFAIDSKLHGCDVVEVRIGDIVAGGRIRDRAMVVQHKTKPSVQFELVEVTTVASGKTDDWGQSSAEAACLVKAATKRARDLFKRHAGLPGRSVEDF